MKLFTLLAAAAPLVGADQRWTLGVDGSLHLLFGSTFQAMNSDGSVKWSFHANSSRIVSHNEGVDGTVHIISQSDLDSRTHYAINGADGSLQWQRTSLDTGRCPDTKGHSNFRLLSSDAGSYLVCMERGEPRGARIEAVDTAGEWKWSARIQDADEVDVGPDGGLLVQTRLGLQSTLTALTPEEGDVKWAVSLDRWFNGWAISNGDIFIAPYHVQEDIHHQYSAPGDLDLLRLSGEAGSIVWNASYGSVKDIHHQCPRRPVLGSNGNVYVYAPVAQSNPQRARYEGSFFGGTHKCDFLAFDVNGTNLFTLPCSGELTASTRLLRNNTQEDFFATSATVPNTNSTHLLTYTENDHWNLNHSFWNASILGRFTVTNAAPDGTVFAHDWKNNQSVAVGSGQLRWRSHYFTTALMARDGTTYLINLAYRNQPEMVEAVDKDGMHKWSYAMVDPIVDSTLSAELLFV